MGTNTTAHTGNDHDHADDDIEVDDWREAAAARMDALLADPESLDKFIAAAAAAETPEELRKAVYGLIPISLSQLPDCYPDDLMGDGPIGDVLAEHRKQVRASLPASIAATDDQLEDTATALRRVQRLDEIAGYDNGQGTREELAAAVETGDPVLIQAALDALPVDLYTLARYCQHTGTMKRHTLASFACAGYFISPAHAAEIVKAKYMALQIINIAGVNLSPMSATYNGERTYSLDELAAHLGEEPEDLIEKLRDHGLPVIEVGADAVIPLH